MAKHIKHVYNEERVNINDLNYFKKMAVIIYFNPNEIVFLLFQIYVFICFAIIIYILILVCIQYATFHIGAFSSSSKQ